VYSAGFLEFGQWPLPGESEATDVRLLAARNITFEAGTINVMRLYLALPIARRKKL